MEPEPLPVTSPVNVTEPTPPAALNVKLPLPSSMMVTLVPAVNDFKVATPAVSELISDVPVPELTTLDSLPPIVASNAADTSMLPAPSTVRLDDTGTMTPPRAVEVAGVKLATAIVITHALLLNVTLVPACKLRRFKVPAVIALIRLTPPPTEEALPSLPLIVADSVAEMSRLPELSTIKFDELMMTPPKTDVVAEGSVYGPGAPIRSV